MNIHSANYTRAHPLMNNILPIKMYIITYKKSLIECGFNLNAVINIYVLLVV